MISTKGRYALRVMLDLAEHGNEGYIPLKDIAKRQAISDKYLESILKSLVKQKMLKGLRGKGGGYQLTRTPAEYSVGEILEVAEGTLAPVACLMDDAEDCPRANQCRTLPMWKKFDSLVHDFFYNITLEQILEETGYGRYLSALPSGETRRANIEMLKEKALAFEQTSYHGIFQFNRYLEQIRKFDVDFGEASLLSEQDNMVRVTSIHKSKGLEFPIVFVSGMGKKFNLEDARKSVVMQEQLGVASD